MASNFDPAKAKALLDDAGWNLGADDVRSKNGQPLHLEIFGTPDEKEAYKELLIAQLQEVGFSAKLTQGTGSDRATAGSNGTYHLINREFEASDPQILVDLFHSKNVGNFAWSMAKNPELDKLLQEQDQTIDLAKRQSSIVAATRRILEKRLCRADLHVALRLGDRGRGPGFPYGARSWYPYFQDAWLKK